MGGARTPAVQVVDDDKGNLQLLQAVISSAEYVRSTVAHDLAVQVKTITAKGQVMLITAKGQVMLTPAKAFSELSITHKFANTSQYKLSTKANETNPKHLFYVSYTPNRLTKIASNVRLYSQEDLQSFMRNIGSAFIQGRLQLGEGGCGISEWMEMMWMREVA